MSSKVALETKGTRLNKLRDVVNKIQEKHIQIKNEHDHMRSEHDQLQKGLEIAHARNIKLQNQLALQADAPVVVKDERIQTICQT